MPPILLRDKVVRALISLLFLVIAIPVCFVTFYVWDSRANRGFEFGYYGDFNRVSNTLSRIPEVRILRAWENHDVTLEEFGFEIAFSNEPPVKLEFPENDRIRYLPKEKIAEALVDLISVKTNRLWQPVVYP